MPVNEERLSKTLFSNTDSTMCTVGKKSTGLTAANEYFELKTRIHDKLLDLIDLSLIDSLDTQVLRREIAKLVEKYCRKK
jgi:pilus assembly protein CpaF